MLLSIETYVGGWRLLRQTNLFYAQVWTGKVIEFLYGSVVITYTQIN